MARPLPPAGVIPARHPDLARLWLTREAGNVAFRHMRRLISALYCVAPGVLEDPDFLERSVVVDGVAPSISPRELQESFSVLAVEAAVVVRDSETGYRVGLVVFADAAESTSATNLKPRPGFYVTCAPASRNGDTRRCILDALDDEAKRRPTAELLRSLVPPQYLLDDEDAEFHLRCVFVYDAGVAGGAYGLCRAARDHLLARGYVCATVVWRGGDAGVVVYDDAETTELVARRAPRLTVRMLDSSLFPMVPNEADREAPLLRRMLPPYIMQEATAEYRRRVMLLSGLDTRPWLCDADEIAYRLQHSVADLRREVEAVVVHRAMGLVVVVLGSPEDAELLLHEPPKTWLLAFGQQASVIGCPPLLPLPPPPHQQHFSSPIDWAGPVAYDRVQNWLTRRLRQSPEAYDMSRDDEAQKIIHNLVGLCALANPATVRSSSFPDRSLLLSGIRRGITRSDLFTRLSTFGALDDVVQNHWRGIAVAVFRSWHGAARLGRQPAEAWNRLGFTGCRRVPGADETHAITADIIVDELVRHRRSL